MIATVITIITSGAACVLPFLLVSPIVSRSAGARAVTETTRSNAPAVSQGTVSRKPYFHIYKGTAVFATTLADWMAKTRKQEFFGCLTKLQLL